MTANVIDMDDIFIATTMEQIETLDERLGTLDADLSNASLSPETRRKMLSEKTDLLDRRGKLHEKISRKQKAATKLSPDEAREEAKERVRALMDRDYRYVHSLAKFIFKGPDGRIEYISKDAIKNDIGELYKPEMFLAFLDILKEDGRWHEKATYSHVPQPPMMLNLIETDFIKPDFEGGPPHPMIDLLIRSVAGEKAANIEHLERLIIAKWANPANYKLPAIILTDPDGGTGKTTFATQLLKTAFGDNAVTAGLSMAQAFGPFNDAVVGRTVVFIDEPVDDVANFNAVKRTIHAEKVQVNPKGLKSYDADNTALYIFASNSVNGAIKLTGKAQDRRFSVIECNRPLLSIVADRLGMTKTAAQEWLNTNMPVIRDRGEVAKWLGWLIAKHGVLHDVNALHGEDYEAAKLQTESDTTRFFRLLFVENAAAVPYILQPTIYKMFLYWKTLNNPGNRGVVKSATFYAELKVWMKLNGAPYQQQEQNVRMADGARTKKHVWIEAGHLAVGKGFTDNSDQYVEMDPLDPDRVRRIKLIMD